MAGSIAYYAILVGVLLWCAAVVTVPLAASAQLPSARIGYSFFSQICHQEDSRSLHLAGFPLAVCARCSAIYFGFLAGVLLYPALSRKMQFPARWAWSIAIIPMLLDVGADLLGVHPVTLQTRLASGTIFGIAAALILTPLLVGALSERFIQYRNHPDNANESKT